MNYELIKSEFYNLLQESIELGKKGDHLTFGEADTIFHKATIYINNLFIEAIDRKRYKEKLNQTNEKYSQETGSRVIAFAHIFKAVIIDIDQRILIKSKNQEAEIVHRDDEGKPLTLEQLKVDFDILEKTNRSTSRTQSKAHDILEQTKARVSELDGKLSQAENEKAELHQEIQRLNQKSVSEKSPFADHQTSAKQFENERLAELENQKQRLRDDIQRLQSTIESLKPEKEKLEKEINQSKTETSETQTNKFPADLSANIIKSLTAAGFDRRQFDRRVTKNKESISYGIYYHKSPMFFAFHQSLDETTFKSVSFTQNTPSHQETNWFIKRNNQGDALTTFDQWVSGHLLDYKNKYDTPDPWDEFFREDKTNYGFKDTNEMFEPEIQKDYSVKLLQLQEAIITKFALVDADQEKVKEAIGELKDQLKKQSKSVWQKYAQAIIIDLVKSLATDKELRKEIFDFIQITVMNLPKFLPII